jgi:hypothetical protein
VAQFLILHRRKYWIAIRIYHNRQEEFFIAEPVMGPIIAILIGALLIAIGVYFAATTATWIGIVVSIGGVATILVGLVMLVELAKGNPAPDGRKK